MKLPKSTDLEDLARVVEAISQSVDNIRETGISERALILLIQHAAPAGVTQKQVRAVLSGMEDLAEFVFPSGKDSS